MTAADWATRWRDDAVERAAIMEAEGVPDAQEKARLDTQRCREREMQPQGALFGEGK